MGSTASGALEAYGIECSYNGLRLAGALAKCEDEEVRVFLMGDAAACAKRGQQTPNSFYNLQRRLNAVILTGGKVAVCGSCMDARGITKAELAEACLWSTLEELNDWTLWADKVMASAPCRPPWPRPGPRLTP